ALAAFGPTVGADGPLNVLLMIRRVDHRVRPDDRPVADPETPVTVDIAAVVEADLVAELDLTAVQPDDQVEVEAALADPLGVMGAKRNYTLRAFGDHHRRGPVSAERGLRQLFEPLRQPEGDR